MSQRSRVLAVDDEPQILRALQVLLDDAGFEVLSATSVASAVQVAATQRPDAAIVDLVLPDGDGVEITKEIRSWSQVPIILLSAIDEDAEKIRALDAGADDYVTKPFNPDELVARLRAALRRMPAESAASTLQVDDLNIDLAGRAISRAGEPIHLTPIEFNLLRALVTHRGRLLTHRTLLVEVWGPEYADDTRVLRVHIANLRRKLEPGVSQPTLITTDPGVGYRFTA